MTDLASRPYVPEAFRQNLPIHDEVQFGPICFETPGMTPQCPPDAPAPAQPPPAQAQPPPTQTQPPPTQTQPPVRRVPTRPIMNLPHSD